MVFAVGALREATRQGSTAGGGAVRLLRSSVTAPLSSVRRVLPSGPNTVGHSRLRRGSFGYAGWLPLVPARWQQYARHLGNQAPRPQSEKEPRPGVEVRRRASRKTTIRYPLSCRQFKTKLHIFSVFVCWGRHRKAWVAQIYWA